MASRMTTWSGGPRTRIVTDVPLIVKVSSTGTPVEFRSTRTVPDVTASPTTLSEAEAEKEPASPAAESSRKPEPPVNPISGFMPSVMAVAAFATPTTVAREPAEVTTSCTVTAPSIWRPPTVIAPLVAARRKTPFAVSIVTE